MDETVPCPTCGPVVPTEKTECPRCGTLLLEQKLEQIARQMREITARASAGPGERLWTVNGVGFTLLRYRPRDADTFIATRWFILAGVPIVPTRRLVVRPIDRVAGISRQTYNFQVLGREPLDWGEVLLTWLSVVVMIAPPTWLFLHMREMNAWVGDGPAMLITLAALALSFFLLWRLHNADKVFKLRPDAQP